MIKVKSADGLEAYISKDRLKEYEKMGYKKVTSRRRRGQDQETEQQNEGE